MRAARCAPLTLMLMADFLLLTADEARQRRCKIYAARTRHARCCRQARYTESDSADAASRCYADVIPG